MTDSVECAILHVENMICGKENKHMATYMIDYENVKTGGLNGISRLTEEDRVIIFYSENANRLTFDLHRRLMECKAAIEYREVTVGGHNALDFQLVTYLGYLIAQNRNGQYLIISNDRGFEYVVNFWRRDGLSIGLLPYLKDPVYALQRVARTKDAPVCGEPASADESVCEELSANEPSLSAETPVSKEIPLTEETPAPVPEDTSEEDVEPGITVEFYAIEDESPAEHAAPVPPEEPVPAEESEAPVSVEAPKKTRRSPRKKPQQKKENASAAEPAPSEKPAAQAARRIPEMDELRELIGALVEDDPELRFVSTAIARYKTKLGLNNALVKNFGNQKAGEIYQKIKQFVR